MEFRWNLVASWKIQFDKTKCLETNSELWFKRFFWMQPDYPGTLKLHLLSVIYSDAPILNATFTRNLCCKSTHLELKCIRTYFIDERLGDNFIISAYWIDKRHQPILLHLHQWIEIHFDDFQNNLKENFDWRSKFAIENWKIAENLPKILPLASLAACVFAAILPTCSGSRFTFTTPFVGRRLWTFLQSRIWPKLFRCISR